MPPGEDPENDSSSDDEGSERPSLRELADTVDERASGDHVPASPPPEETYEPPEEPPASGAPDDEAADPSEPEDDADAPEPEPAGVAGHDLPDDGARLDAVIDLVAGRDESVLVLGPLDDPAHYDVCSRLIAGSAEGTDDLLLVTVTDPAEERVSLYQGYLERFPEETSVLAVGDPGRDGTTETITVGDDQSVTIVSVTDATDMMRLGIVISKITSGWDDGGGDSVVCFHSLTGLIEGSLDVQAVFRFTHILLARLKKSGIRVHFHMDPEAHDADTLDTFLTLFDEIITVDADGVVDLAD